MKEVYFEGKPIVVMVHAMKRARQREIAYPDHVFNVIKTGNVKRFGKHGVKFIGKSRKKGSVICVGEDIGHAIIIKTERGN